MPIRVTSKRSGGVAAKDTELVINIARPSVLGNPFPMHRECMRAQVIEQYQDWLKEQRRNNTAAWSEVLRIAKLVREGNSVALDCWCAPKSCHGGVIVRAINRINKKEHDD